jgi:hypothetical protein
MQHHSSSPFAPIQQAV